jgi:hypothetical protein
VRETILAGLLFADAKDGAWIKGGSEVLVNVSFRWATFVYVIQNLYNMYFVPFVLPPLSLPIFVFRLDKITPV